MQKKIEREKKRAQAEISARTNTYVNSNCIQKIFCLHVNFRYSGLLFIIYRFNFSTYTSRTRLQRMIIFFCFYFLKL